jgi:hypothetical protein
MPLPITELAVPVHARANSVPRNWVLETPIAPLRRRSDHHQALRLSSALVIDPSNGGSAN